MKHTAAAAETGLNPVPGTVAATHPGDRIMFGLFRRKPTAPASPYGYRLGWRVLTVTFGDQWLSLQVEPMRDGPCRVYVPSATRWRADAPAWARDLREVLLAGARAVPFNRDLDWPESDDALFWPLPAWVPADGSLESTPGGQQLSSMRLFDADNPSRFSRAQAKQAWCKGAEAMCRQVKGPVNIEQTAVVPGSVFQTIELPALHANPRVQLHYIGAAA